MLRAGRYSDDGPLNAPQSLFRCTAIRRWLGGLGRVSSTVAFPIWPNAAEAACGNRTRASMQLPRRRSKDCVPCAT
jgi:hypothetical protein